MTTYMLDVPVDLTEMLREKNEATAPEFQDFPVRAKFFPAEGEVLHLELEGDGTIHVKHPEGWVALVEDGKLAGFMENR